MKHRTEIKGSKNDNWETPQYIKNWVSWECFWHNGFFDPCPLSEKVWDDYILQFDWLAIDWENRNFINPPYNITDKPKFVKKAFQEYQKWNICVLLIPATTETQWFHEYLVPYAQIFFLKWRVKFLWYNSKWEYVTNKTWQSWSMICVLDPNKKPCMKWIFIDEKKYSK